MRNLLFLLLVFISFSVFAQNEMASGKITNPRGEPVSFATVTVKGTKTTVVADADGTFKIQSHIRVRSWLFLRPPILRRNFN